MGVGPHNCESLSSNPIAYIGQARSSDSNYLELKFRPEDPCAHAAFRELQQTSDLLLRIKRKPRRNLLKSCVSGTTDTAPGSSSPGYEVSADIIARVENTYNFEGQFFSQPLHCSMVSYE